MHTYTHTGTYADIVCSECTHTHTHTDCTPKAKINILQVITFSHPGRLVFEMVTTVNIAFFLCAKKHFQLVLLSYDCKWWTANNN